MNPDSLDRLKRLNEEYKQLLDELHQQEATFDPLRQRLHEAQRALMMEAFISLDKTKSVAEVAKILYGDDSYSSCLALSQQIGQAFAEFVRLHYHRESRKDS